MANGSFIGVTPGAGAKLATGPTYTENANVVQDEKVIFGLPYFASYVASFAGVALATINSTLAQLQAGASLPVYVTRVRIWQTAAVTTGGLNAFQLVRSTSAGTGGTAVTPAPADTTDAASGAAGMALTPTVGPTLTTSIIQSDAYLEQTVPASQAIAPALIVDWQFGIDMRTKPIRIPAGTANGLVVRNRVAQAAGTVSWAIDFFELPF